MINWILGGIIIGLTIFVIVRVSRKASKGESSCGCCQDCSIKDHKCH